MLRIALLFALALVATSGCGSAGSPPPPPAESPPPVERWLTPITDASQVCMVNDTWMGRPQIPVPVDGKTYFGCCEGCKARLGTDPTTRFARDPVTGAAVDKATAVMARDDAGVVYYFASKDNMGRYRL